MYSTHCPPLTTYSLLQVFDIFDTDSTGGIDQHEFHQITALLGNHASETETRALFLSADKAAPYTYHHACT